MMLSGHSFPLSDFDERGCSGGHSLREVFNGLPWMLRAGASWRMIPHDLPPWPIIYQQTMRWIKPRAFESIVHDLRQILRPAQGRNKQPSAAVLDSQPPRSTPESGGREDYDGHKKRMEYSFKSLNCPRQKKGICPAPQKMGCGEILCLEESVPKAYSLNVARNLNCLSYLL